MFVISSAAVYLVYICDVFVHDLNVYTSIFRGNFMFGKSRINGSKIVIIYMYLQFYL